MTSHHWMQLSGALGEHLLCPEVSGIKAPQATAMCGILRIIGMQRLKVTAPSEAPVKQTYVVETLIGPVRNPSSTLHVYDGTASATTLLRRRWLGG